MSYCYCLEFGFHGNSGLSGSRESYSFLNSEAGIAPSQYGHQPCRIKKCKIPVCVKLFLEMRCWGSHEEVRVHKRETAAPKSW
jgi:hypothetical protein